MLRRMLLAFGISAIGDCLRDVALAAVILAATDSVLAAGLVFVAVKLPSAIFALAGGFLIDRWEARRVMVTADVVRGLLVALLPVAVVTSLPLVYALLFVTSGLTMLFTTAQQSSLPTWVDHDDLMGANSLFHGARYVTEIGGYSLAGAFVAVLVNRLGAFEGTRLAFAFDALTFFASAALLARLPARVSAASASPPIVSKLRAQLADTLRFLRRQPYVRANFLLFVVVPLALGGFQTLWVGHAWRISHTEAAGYAVLQLSWGIGTVVGLTILPRVTARLNTGRVVLLGWLLWGAGTCGLGLTGSLEGAAILVASSGIGNMLAVIPSITLIQRLTPSDLRGRVFGVRYSVAFLAVAVASAVTGSLADRTDVATLSLAMGGAAVGIVGLAYFWPDLREAA